MQSQAKMELVGNRTGTPIPDISRVDPRLGLFSYPVLQAADVLVHRYVA